MTTHVPYDRAGHLIRVSADLPDGRPGRFLVDTGIGITVVGSALRERLHLEDSGATFTGRRMSGQEISSPLVGPLPLSLGGRNLSARTVALADLGSPRRPDGFDGILGLDVLGELPLTVDPFAERIVLGAEPGPGEVLTTRVARDGPSVEMSVDLALPSGATVEAEVDTGSGNTILADRFMADCGVSAEDATSTRQGEDETGHVYVRRWIPIVGSLAVVGHPSTSQADPTVMFQEIERDALVGTEFLDRWVQTYDTRDGTITLAPPRR